MALSLGASDNPKTSWKGGLTSHNCSKIGHSAREYPDRRKLPKAGSNTSTMSRDVCRYCKVEKHTYKSSKDHKQIPTKRLYNYQKFKDLANTTERSDAIEYVKGCTICTATDHDRNSGRCPLKKRNWNYCCDQLGCKEVNCRLFHGSPSAYCKAVSIVVNKASLAECSTSSLSMSGRDQAEELRGIQVDLPNMNIDEGVVLAAQQVEISRHQALVFWDNGATLSFIRDEFARKPGLRGIPTSFIVKTMGGNRTEEASTNLTWLGLMEDVILSGPLGSGTSWTLPLLTYKESSKCSQVLSSLQQTIWRGGHIDRFQLLRLHPKPLENLGLSERGTIKYMDDH